MTFDDISIFLEPSQISTNTYSDDALGGKVLFIEKKSYKNEFFQKKLVILGIMEDRGNIENKGSSNIVTGKQIGRAHV